MPFSQVPADAKELVGRRDENVRAIRGEAGRVAAAGACVWLQRTEEHPAERVLHRQRGGALLHQRGWYSVHAVGEQAEVLSGARGRNLLPHPPPREERFLSTR